MASENDYIIVDCARAMRWLEVFTDEKQRSLSDTIVGAYAEDMLAGQWHDNGSSIVFYGPLIGGEVTESTMGADGQHRLWAVVEAAGKKPDFSVEFLTVWNVEVKAAASIDGGRPRTYSHHKNILNRPNASRIPAVVRRVNNWDKGYRLPVGNARAVLTNPGIDRTYLADQEAYDESFRQGARLCNKFGVNRAGAAVAFHLIARFDKDRAVKFYDDICNWQNLGIPGHPVLALVASFAKPEKKTRTASLPFDPTLMMIILCWNAIMQGGKERSRFILKNEYYTNGGFPMPLPPGAKKPTRTRPTRSSHELAAA